MNQPTAAQLKTLTTIAADAGADGIWLIRGTDYASLRCIWPDDYSENDETEHPGSALIVTEPHELIVLLRFPTGDGGESGIEHR